MSEASYQQAVALLDAMGPIGAGRILESPVDFREFLSSNRLDLEEDEIRRLKDRFRV